MGWNGRRKKKRIIAAAYSFQLPYKSNFYWLAGSSRPTAGTKRTGHKTEEGWGASLSSKSKRRMSQIFPLLLTADANGIAPPLPSLPVPPPETTPCRSKPPCAMISAMVVKGGDLQTSTSPSLHCLRFWIGCTLQLVYKYPTTMCRTCLNGQPTGSINEGKHDDCYKKWKFRLRVAPWIDLDIFEVLLCTTVNHS